MKGSLRDARCSFCGKRQDQVRKLVAGPGVYICDGCIALCNEVLAAPTPPPPIPTAPSRGRWKIWRPKRPHAMARLRQVAD